MKRLALATWRLTHAGLARVEQARQAAGQADEAPDVFTLATCQRVLACTLAEDPSQAAGRLAETYGPAGGERYTGPDALAHLARVAASLDSLVPGEDQVPNQFREELDRREADLDPALLERLQRVRFLARKARDEGGLAGHEGRSVVDLAERVLPEEGPLAVVGTGTIARRALEALDEGRPVHVVSRSTERAAELADDDARAWSRAAFLADPPALRGLVLSTRAPDEPIVDAEAGRRLAEASPASDALAVVDLGVPRNADPELQRLANLRLRTLEDLARVARTSPLEDPKIDDARQALEAALAAERRRRRGRRLDERVVALREQLARELDELADDIEALDEDARQAWIRRAHGRLAHTSQRHLEAALRRDPPP